MTGARGARFTCQNGALAGVAAGRSPASSRPRVTLGPALALAAVPVLARLALVTFAEALRRLTPTSIRLQLVDSALLAFLGLIRPLPQSALHDRPGAPGHALGDVLGGLAPHVDGQEQASPLPRRPVQPRGRGDGSSQS